MPHAVCYVHAYVPHHNAGAETTIHDLNRALVAAGWHVTVLLSRPSEPEVVQPYTIDGVRVIPFLSKHQPGEWFAKADVVISHLDSSERAAYLTRQLGVPLVQVIHNTMWQTEGYLSIGCELAVYNTDWVKKHHDQAAESLVSKIATLGQVTWSIRQYSEWDSVVVHPPIDASRYEIPDNAPAERGYVTLVNLWAGATDGWTGKGPHILYALAKEMPDVNFMGVVGGYGAQDIRSDVKNVRIVENTADITREVYAHTKVLLMPSKYESFGRVAIEAAASGIPTIANPTEGLVEALGPDGIFCPLDDIRRWKITLRHLLANRDYYKLQSDAARLRSAYWTAQRETELAEFVSAVNNVVAKE